MTPEQLQEFEALKRTVANIQRAEDITFLESIKKRLDIDARFKNIRLNDLKDVNTNGVTNGQVIKYTSSTDIWDKANDIDT